MNDPIEQRLRAAAAGLTRERIQLRELAALHGADVDGTLLVLLAALCIIPVPGVGTMAGVALGMLAIAAWRGCAGRTLPLRLGALEISAASARRLLGALATVYGLARRHARPGVECRLSRAMAAMLGVMATLMVLPIPFGNILPGLSVAALGLAMVFRDRRLAALALLVSAMALVFAAGMTVVAAYGSWCAIATACSLT